MRQKVGSGVKWEARNASGLAAQATLENINVHEVRFLTDSCRMHFHNSIDAGAGAVVVC